MKFSVGDKILLKRTGEEGVVIAMLSDVMMEVMVNSIHFPVYTDEVDHPYLKWFTEKKQQQKRVVSEIPAERQRDRPARLAQGIYLSFMPVYVLEAMEDLVSHFRIFLLNETNAPLVFSYEAVSAAGHKLFVHKGSLHAFGNIYLHSLTLEEMNEQPRFHWLAAEHAERLQNTGNKGILRIKPAKLFEQITMIQQSGQPSFNYFLSDDATGISKPATGKTELPLPLVPEISIPQISTAWQPRAVLDLHVEQLTDHYETMTPAEVLQLQMDTLHYHLDMAVAHNQQRLVVIHGLGTGALRNAVHQVLDEQKEIASYSNEWQGQYGYGATVIIFR